MNMSLSTNSQIVKDLGISTAKCLKKRYNQVKFNFLLQEEFGDDFKWYYYLILNAFNFKVQNPGTSQRIFSRVFLKMQILIKLLYQFTAYLIENLFWRVRDSYEMIGILRFIIHYQLTSPACQLFRKRISCSRTSAKSKLQMYPSRVMHTASTTPIQNLWSVFICKMNLSTLTFHQKEIVFIRRCSKKDNAQDNRVKMSR